MIRAEWRGLVPYGAALDAQRRYRDAVVAGAAPEALWGLEHPGVVTTGRRPVEDLAPPEVYSAAGFELFPTERGGLATCHEPGQLVVYLFLDVRDLGIRRAMAAVEAGVIAWLVEQGAPAHRRPGYPGVWLGRDKVCAVGMHVSRGVTMHGLALNLVNDLRGFALITPCGIADGGVTTLQRALGRSPTPVEAWPGVAAALDAAIADERARLALDTTRPLS